MKRLGIGIVTVVVAVALGVLIARWWLHVNVAPEPPISEAVPFVLPATSSRLSLAVSCPKSSLVSQLEKAIKDFAFDVNQNGTRAYGTLSRTDPINVAIDVPTKRVSFTTAVSGHVQIEKRVKVDLLLTKVDKLISIGTHGTAHLTASLSPAITLNWTVDPQLSLSAHADKVVASGVPIFGEIDVTGHVQGEIDKALPSVKAAADAKLKEVLAVRSKVDRLWKEINSVYNLAEKPPTWLRITPQKASFGQFQYTNDSINSGLALDLETHVFLQDSAPLVVNSPLPNLQVNADLSDALDLSIPVEVSYSVINEQLKTQLTNNPISLPQDTSVKINIVSIEPYGDGILLTLDFSANKGWFRSASGRLYLVGTPVFDAGKAELCVDKLDFTVATKNILVKSADWLLHDKALDEVKSAAVVKLDSELKKATTEANEKLVELKRKLPKEVGANVSITKITVEGIAFARERAFALVAAKGKMSAQLKP